MLHSGSRSQLTIPRPLDLYMMPFNRRFGMRFSNSELEEVWGLMTEEREIRVRSHWRADPAEDRRSESSSDGSISEED